MKNDDLLHKWIENTISEEELIIFKQRPEFQELQEIYTQTDQLIIPEFDAESVLNNILQNKKTQQKQEAKVFSLKNIIQISAAACALLFIGYFVWPQDNMVYISVAQGQKLTKTLPDGSIVNLNADSELSYDANNWEQNRMVSLKGEAQFMVEKGESFIVESNQGSVQVLGTVFNIKDREEKFTVSCTEGKVAVNSKHQIDETILTAGEFVQYENGKIINRSDLNAEDLDSWVEDISRFENTALREILDEMERQYSVKINSKDIDQNEKISCNFRHDNIEVALKSVTLPLGLTFVINEHEILIRK